MADLKISQLGSIVTVVPATDVLPVVQGATTYKMTPNQILGSGGVATLASATITGAATVGTTLGVTGASTLTGNVGVGIAPTAGRLHVKGGASQSPLALDTLGYNQIVLQVSGANRGQIYADATNCFAVVNSAGSGTPLVVADTGNVSIANGNLVMSTSGKGIDFAATANSSGTMTSELLNDYEEGTWTIGLTFGGGNTALTTDSNVGRYTKVGRQVTVTGVLILTSKGSSTGAASVTGLPFSIGNNYDSYSAASLRFNGISYVGAFQAFGTLGSTSIGFEQISTLGAVSSLTDVNFTNVSSFIFTFTYTV